MRRPQMRRDLDEERDLREPILTNAEIFEAGARRITNGLVIGAAIIGLAIWARPGPSDFQGFASKDGVIRLNLDSGSMIECRDGTCTQILRPGQRLLRAKATIGDEDEDVPEAPLQPAAPIQKQLPPPSPAAPAAPNAPSPSQAQPTAR